VAHFGNGAKTRLRIVTVGIAFLVGISLGLPSANEALEAEQTHVVKRGDTLSKIAQEHLGSHEKYMELAELNGLEIETIDGVDYMAEDRAGGQVVVDRGLRFAEILGIDCGTHREGEAY